MTRDDAAQVAREGAQDQGGARRARLRDRIDLACCECGRVFWTSNPWGSECPECGSTDLDVAP